MRNKFCKDLKTKRKCLENSSSSVSSPSSLPSPSSKLLKPNGMATDMNTPDTTEATEATDTPTDTVDMDMVDTDM